MSIAEGVLKEEYNRLLELEKFYSSENNKFPKVIVIFFNIIDKYNEISYVFYLNIE